MVLAHPLGMSQAVWDDLLPALLPRYRVLTWDLPGHSASQAWSDGPIMAALKEMGRGDDDSYARLCEMLGRDTFDGKLAGKGVTVQLLGGSEDLATPPATLEALAAELDGAPWRSSRVSATCPRWRCRRASPRRCWR
ncbi:MAG: alpha/beta fold hydrolase [Halomonas sp.]